VCGSDDTELPSDSHSNSHSYGMRQQHAHFGISRGDSLLRLLLRVQSTQSALLRLLTQKLVQYSLKEVDKEEDRGVAMGVLNNIRYCETVYSPRHLLLLLVDALKILPEKIQVEVISALPGIVFISHII
jgi:Fanconi anaemia protein FancD2 nuclease